MAQYSYSFRADPDDAVPDSPFYVAGTVSVVISNASSDVPDWTLGLRLWNPNTGNATPTHYVTSSNSSTVFTDMIAGDYKLLLRSASDWVIGTATIYN